MDKEQATQYVSDLISERRKVTDPAEVELLNGLRSAHAGVLKAVEEIQAARRETARLETLLSRCEGKREAFADLLVSVENRRGALAIADHVETTSVLQELRTLIQDADSAEIVQIPTLRK